MAQLHLRLKELYEKEGGAFADPILNLHWPYKDADDPHPAEIAKEINGYVRSGRAGSGRSRPSWCSRRASRCRSSRLLRDDGSDRRAAAGSTPAATPRPATTMARRDTADPDDTGAYPEMGVLVAGQPAHPLQSCVGGPSGQAVGFHAQADRVERRAKWTGYDVPGHRADGQAGTSCSPSS